MQRFYKLTLYRDYYTSGTLYTLQTQVMVVAMENCGWQMDQLAMLAGLRSAGMTFGEQCVIKTGPEQTQSLHADSWATTQDVSVQSASYRVVTWCIYITQMKKRNHLSLWTSFRYCLKQQIVQGLRRDCLIVITTSHLHTAASMKKM